MMAKGKGSPPRVLVFGETMLMFAPPEHELIEHSEYFRAFIGGSEVNVAVGLERLGIHTGWVGKLPRNALGRKVVNGVRRYGVDTSGVVWANEGRVGTFYIERGARPRPTKTIYDRAGSAFATLTADELDWDAIGQAEWLHLTGITPALSETCRRNAPEILKRARARGVKISLDLNYRSKLWAPAEAREAWLELLPYVNLLIATEPDAAILLGETRDREDTLRHLFETHGPDAVVMTTQPASVSIGEPQLPTFTDSHISLGRRMIFASLQWCGLSENMIKRFSLSCRESITKRPPTRRGKSAMPLFCTASPLRVRT